ncbi:MAG: tetratricopeptide repeat protein [Pseudomonadota bacterium]
MLKSLLLAATLLIPAAAQAQGVAGPYLAARIAGYSNDYDSAARYYDRLLRTRTVTPQVLENAVIIYGVLGRFDDAAEAADRLIAAGQPSQFANAVRLITFLKNEDLAAASELLGGSGSVGGALLDGLIDGWIAAANGDVAAAEEAFDALAQRRAFMTIARLHQAYLRAMSGNFEGAQDILSGDAYGALSLTTRGTTAQAQVLVELGRIEDAAELLNQAAAATNSPVLQSQADQLAAGEPLSWDFITDPKEGMAEAYFTLAAILAGETSPTFTLLNARAAAVLRPSHVDALILVGELFEMQSQYDLASDTLTQVPRDDPSFFGAEITRAEVLLADGREEAAVEVLRALTRSHPDEQTVWTAYGDVLRRLERFEESAEAYDRAISMIDEDTPEDWFLYYVRGIAVERTGVWDAAEADFRRALDLNPDQPLVLNYLGYGLVEQRMKLDEALDMIERAVAARPDDGYITDSLGWVLYRLGRYEEAVPPMERAVQLQPLDPIINDHLGDVLWTVGRRLEAEFQWRRALSLDPEETDETRIRRKLDVGLDVVLEEEGGKGAIEAADE